MLHGTRKAEEVPRCIGNFMRKMAGGQRFWQMESDQNNLHSGDQGPIELYDLYRDPGETFDVSQGAPPTHRKSKENI